MKKENKSFNLIEALKSIFKTNKSSDKNSRPKHRPSWMYKNE